MKRCIIVCLVCALLFLLCACATDSKVNAKGYIDEFTCEYCGTKFSVVPSDLYEIKWPGLFNQTHVSKAFDCPSCHTTYAWTAMSGWHFADVEFEVCGSK